MKTLININESHNNELENIIYGDEGYSQLEIIDDVDDVILKISETINKSKSISFRTSKINVQEIIDKLNILL